MPTSAEVDELQLGSGVPVVRVLRTVFDELKRMEAWAQDHPDEVASLLADYGVTTLELEPLAAHDIKRLVQTRLGVDALPVALVQQVTEKPGAQFHINAVAGMGEHVSAQAGQEDFEQRNHQRRIALFGNLRQFLGSNAGHRLRQIK